MAKDMCGKLKKSEYRQVLDELAPHKDKQLPNCPINLHGYISNNIDGIDYKAYEPKFCNHFDTYKPKASKIKAS